MKISILCCVLLSLFSCTREIVILDNINEIQIGVNRKEHDKVWNKYIDSGLISEYGFTKLYGIDCLLTVRSCGTYREYISAIVVTPDNAHFAESLYDSIKQQNVTLSIFLDPIIVRDGFLSPYHGESSIIIISDTNSVMVNNGSLRCK